MENFKHHVLDDVTAEKERKIKNVVLVIVIAMISVGALLNLLAWNGIGRPYTIDAGIWIGSVGVGLGWLAGKILF